MNKPCEGGAEKDGAAIFCARIEPNKGLPHRRSCRLYAPESPRLTAAQPVCRRYTRCQNCPYPHHGFLCWSKDDSCLRTVVRRINHPAEKQENEENRIT